MHTSLGRGRPGLPTEHTLQRLFETMYFASLRTEEGHSIAFHIVYMNPEDPDPSPPERIVQDRWSYVVLECRVPFDVSNVTKISRASDPRSSSLAVYHNQNGDLFVWGLVDQGNSYFDFVNHDSEEGPERPGLFQASISGVGHVSVYRGYELIADLLINDLHPRAIDALDQGPVHDALAPGIRSYIEAVRSDLTDEQYDARGHWVTSLTADWLTAVRRLLLRIRQYRHGGAVLITPASDFNNLNIKYAIDYRRLQTALRRRAVFTVRHTYAQDEITSGFIDKNLDHVPTDLYLDESIAANDLEESRTELDGVLWLISLLSRVDGLVLLTPDLAVRGFGVEIQTNTPPLVLLRALDSRASRKRGVAIDYNHYGTRHRSMMRYCANVPGSIGFVISQDGDVRAMTLVRGELVMWDNIELRHDDFERRRRKRKEVIPRVV